MVVASLECLWPILRTDGVAKLLPWPRLEERQFGEPIADAALVNADLPSSRSTLTTVPSIARIGAIRERQPNLPVVAAIEGTNVSLVAPLVRQGMSDVVALPFDLDELLQVCLTHRLQADRRGNLQPSWRP